MKNVYLVFRKKRVFTPKMDLSFQGIVDIVTACETKELAQEYLESNYECEKADFYNYKEAFAKGDVYWDDALFQMYQYEKDKTVIVNWEITQVNLQK